MSRSDPGRSLTRRDLRLVGPAGGAWLSALATLLLLDAVPGPDRSPTATTLMAGAAVVAVVAVAVVAVAAVVMVGRGGARPVAARAGVALRTWVVPAVLGAACGCAAATSHVASLSADPIASWAQDRAVAELTVRVEGDARVVSGRSSSWARDLQQVRARALDISARGQRIAVDVPILLQTGVGPPGLPADGTTVQLVARLGPGDVLRDVAARARIVGPWQATAAPPPGAAAATAVRRGLQEALAGAPSDAAALVAGLCVGDESGQDEDLAAAMKGSGLSHLTAVSGGNVAIVLVAVLWLARVARLRRRGRVLVAAVALAGFVVLVRPQPSVLRAAAMGSVAVLALAVGGRRRSVPALSASVLVLVMVAPTLAASFGFALSTAATAGLVWISEPMRRGLGDWRMTARLPPALLDATVVTLAAQVATAPLIAALGGGIGLAALPANLLAAPAVAPVTVIGLVAALLSPVWPAAAHLLAGLAVWPAAWIAAVARTCARLPLASLPWPEGWIGGVSLAVTGAVAALAWWVRGRLRRPALPAGGRGLLLLVTLAILLLCIRGPARVGWPPPGWAAVACDVGQGDAVVVRTAADSAVVVDAGPDPIAVDACLSALGIRRIPVLLLTHFHADHVDGVAGVLNGRDVGQVLTTPVPEPAEQYRLVVERLAEAGLSARAVSAGEVRDVGDVRMSVLWPRRVIRSAGSVPNNASAVLLVEGRGVRLLLTGDVEPAAQASIMGSAPVPDVDVVKVPHHGSAYQHPAFAGWARPEVALVSVGAGNDYGHPAESTLRGYASAGALVARTDELGDVAVVPDGAGSVGLVAHR